ncbi:pyridoxamine 5'-phosphate oxidase family protein [Nonomuraea angiospora]|uniref:PPOX class probable F420-dependent enzyme n=1 Tax=Nonomuraea angiospora TaxID=46172 RepID=A0ABR9LSV4_9ACTN|nr:pyridoxamine 5'-phosphate oxidase family protein [Nonomuraea angiospora]MBE1583746.1 PPOX class probable F420-dependent enzyme [Nonomuraea angiospora]MDX3109174.1 pyridoxamine 5'-phosphate oxidase family protein [Nonomuraea angiospora]
MNLVEQGDAFAAFWQERHLCTLSTARPDGPPHVVPVGATLDLATGIARVITSGTSVKAGLIGTDGAPVALCQVDGRRWSTLEGRAVLRTEPEQVADAEHRYAARYKPPRPNPARVVVEIQVTRVLGNV